MNAHMKIYALTALMLITHGVHAGQVTNLTTFSAGTPAKAAEVNANFNAVKTAVDDNNTRIEANTADIDDHAKRIQKLENAVGALLNQRRGNYTVPEIPPGGTGYTGYIAVAPRIDVVDEKGVITHEVLDSYKPSVNARAFVQTRCSFDGDSAGQILEHRAAIRSNKSNSEVVVGGQYYLRTMTPAANISVQDVNSDYFNLTAGVPYDFGVYFFEGNAQFSAKPTPKNGASRSDGNNEDFCSAVVMIFTR